MYIYIYHIIIIYTTHYNNTYWNIHHIYFCILLYTPSVFQRTTNIRRAAGCIGPHPPRPQCCRMGRPGMSWFYWTYLKIWQHCYIIISTPQFHDGCSWFIMFPWIFISSPLNDGHLPWPMDQFAHLVPGWVRCRVPSSARCAGWRARAGRLDCPGDSGALGCAPFDQWPPCLRRRLGSWRSSAMSGNRGSPAHKLRPSRTLGCALQ